MWKGAIYRLFLWCSHRRPPSSERANVVWHLQWCWSPACTCCSAVGPLPSGRRFSGNRKRARRPSVINGHICAAENTTGLSAAIFLTHGPTGWELHNKSVKLLMLILNCFSSSIVCVCGCVALHDTHVSGGITVPVRFGVVCPAKDRSPLLYHAPQFTSQDCLWKKCFISPPSCQSEFDWHSVFFLLRMCYF